MEIIDLHCDTISKIFHSNNKKNLKNNNLCVDISKLRKGNSLAQFFALYINNDLNPDMFGYSNIYEYAMAMLDKFHIEIKENSKYIRIARNFSELNENRKENKISAFLTIEGGGIIEKDLSKLRNFYRLGVRLITLTWNYPNCIGYPNIIKKYRNKGLTDFGKQLIEELNNLGIIVDVSHLSDAGFYDVAEIAKKPFVASHSNARYIRNHPRNLTDDMIKIISEKGGIVGINFSASFLGNSDISRVDDIIRHIKYIRDKGGIDSVALGSDFDGISCEMEISDFAKMGILVEKLKDEGFSINEIEKICYNNAIRIVKESMN